MKLKKIIPPFLPLNSEGMEAYATADGLHILKSIDNTLQWGKLKHIIILLLYFHHKNYMLSAMINMLLEDIPP